MPSLTEKYRPQSFDEVVGQEKAVGILKGFVKDADRPSSYLFAGPSGTGKTTCARIFAKELGAQPHDIAEVDAADMRGIDTIREMKQWAMAKPFGKAKVCIFDEAHMFTREAQNALLKLLEDPPKHTYFIICTTDPQKLIQTVKSRCVRVDFESVDADAIAGLLKWIAEEEDIDFPKSLLLRIADSALGSPRVAIKILEKVKHLPPKEAAKAIGNAAEESDAVIRLCRLLLRGAAWTDVAKVLKELKDGYHPEQVRRVVMSYMASVLLNKKSDQAAVILDIFRDPVWESFPTLVLYCYEVVEGGK